MNRLGKTLARWRRQFLRWITTPFRIIARAFIWLLDLTPRQMQTFCIYSLIGGTVAGSIWIYIYVRKVEKAVYFGIPNDSPLYELIFAVVKYISIMQWIFAGFMCLIAFGAEWMQVRWKGIAAGAGKGEAPGNLLQPSDEQQDYPYQQEAVPDYGQDYDYAPPAPAPRRRRKKAYNPLEDPNMR